MITADPTAAREIVFNLLSNAAKYSTPEAPIHLNVGRDGEVARLVVRAHGGDITVRPADNSGSEFVLELPA